MVDREEIIADLRAVLISRKEMATVVNLNRDFKELHGTYIPFRRLGYSNVEDFLRSDPTFVINGHGSEAFVTVVPKKESKHISDMIAKQKTSRKRSAPVLPPRSLNARSMHMTHANTPPRTYFSNIGQNRTSRSAQQYCKKPATQHWYPPINNVTGQFNFMQNQNQSLVQPRPSTSQVQPLISRLNSQMQPLISRSNSQVQPLISRSNSQMQSQLNTMRSGHMTFPVQPTKPPAALIQFQVPKPAQPLIQSKPLSSPVPSQVPTSLQVSTSSQVHPKTQSELSTRLRLESESQKSVQIQPSVSVKSPSKPQIQLNQSLKENTTPNVPQLLKGNSQAQVSPPTSKVDPVTTSSELLEKMFEKRPMRMPKAAQKVEIVPKKSDSSMPYASNDNNNNVNTRSVSLRSANTYRGSFRTLQVTMQTNPIIIKTSAQDRLDKIRHRQSQREIDYSSGKSEITSPEVKMTPMPGVKVSQQSRLLKYKNPDLSSDTIVGSNNNNNEAITPKVVLEEFISYQKLLTDYCRERNISPPHIRTALNDVHKHFNIGEREESYGCVVKVGNVNSFGSFCPTYTKPEQAAEDACKKALQALIKIYGSVEDKHLAVTDGKLVPNRLWQLLAGHSKGKYTNVIPEEYRAEYRENLPEDWLDIVRMSKTFNIEDSTPGGMIVSVKTQPDVPLPKQDSVDFVDPPPIVLPRKDTHWNVHITTVCSTVEIWCRLIGSQYTNLFDELSSYMKDTLDAGKIKPETVFVGAYYAVNVTESWYRIQVLEVQDERALCFFIDIGGESWHLQVELYVLDKKFRYVSAQAILFQLAGLEEYAENKYALELLNEYMLNKSLIAEVLQDENGESAVFPVILFDTYTEEDVNLNDLLKKKIKDEEKSPKLREKGRINDKIFVSYICDNGDVYIQIRNETFTYLMSQIQHVNDMGFSNEDIADSVKLLHERSSDRMYLTAKPEENKCYRVIAIGPVDKGQVPVYFVDYGFTGVADTSKIIATFKVSSVIDEFPHQALKVTLSGFEDFTPSLVSRLRGCLFNNNPILVKVLENAEVPVVEIFMRTRDQLLISVNNAIQNEMELEKNSLEEEFNLLEKRMSRMSLSKAGSLTKAFSSSLEQKTLKSKSLPEPKIPCVESYFPVTVIMAASPENFVVQPCSKDNQDFRNMMKELQVVCDNNKSSIPASQEIEKGNIYAGKYTDGIWYRVQVTEIARENLVVVYFCDYGDYDVMKFDDLQKLSPHFLRVPYNALRARLGAVSFMKHDWSTEDCLRFQQLVCNKAFVGIVNSLGLVDSNNNEKVICLTLIDTDSENDVYITPEFLLSNTA
ncbi:tudor domain-containing protein 7A-like [Ctenocephalides felis]|uniref:tudor domain-containing protein 7A-like n=1 Tax=Ctenocephalides felis TaxID=7515 RepID=UPI000E6E1CBF|nr:tudor domain-containing protein 7A-like [Ctenocephalides felis]